MLPQKNFFVKRPRWQIVAPVVLGMVLFTAVILSVFSQSEEKGYLPIVFQDGQPGTPTATSTAVPPCSVYFADNPQAGEDHVLVSGEVNSIVSIVNLITGETMGTDSLTTTAGYNCLGAADYSPPYQLSGLLTGGDELQAQSDDGSADTAVVSPDPTITPPATGLSVVTILTTTTPSPTPTPVAGTPDITLLPTCGTPQSNPGEVTFDVIFSFWPTNHSLTLLWDGNLLQSWEAGQHTGFFTLSITRMVAADPATYTVTAVSGSGSTDSELFTVPCFTSASVDLVAVGPPQLISTPPIVAYQPVQFSIPITNTSDSDVNNQFFVDIYLDPHPELVLSTTIPITESDGYAAVSSLDAGASKIVTITAQLGYGNSPADHHTYAFVDSLEQVVETDETNNITDPLTGIQITPAATPTPVITLTPVPVHSITGLAYTFEDGFQPQFRAQLQLIDEATGETIATGMSDITGAYAFLNLPATTTYRVEGCLNMDGVAYFGYRTHLTPPQDLTYISLLPRPCTTPTPTPTPAPGGLAEISGGALRLGDDLVLQFRATMQLIDNSIGNVVAVTTSDINGHYAFYNVAQPTTTYTVTGCITIDGEEWYGWLTGIVPPNSNAHVIMLKRPCLASTAP